MTQIEKDELLRQIQEQQTELLATMAKSDAHASKCAKLNLTFSEEYPEEYQEYCSARERYNANQTYMATIADAPIEEPIQHPLHEDN